MNTRHFSAKSLTTGALWGIAGGILLIVATVLTNVGILQVFPYVFVLSGAILTIKYSKHVSFSNLFIGGMVTFLIMSVILYLYLALVVNPHSGITLFGHLWRIAAITAMGSLGSLFLSFLAKPVQRQNA